MILYKVSILLFLLFAAIQSFSQNATPDLLTEIDGISYLKKSSEPFSGKFIENYPNEKIVGKEGHYLDGKMVGKWIWYYKDGKIKRESEYFNNSKNGKTTYWFKDGKKQSETTYKDDNLDGKSIWFHTNGIKKKEATYNNGKYVSGSEWDENGNLINGSFSGE